MTHSIPRRPIFLPPPSELSWWVILLLILALLSFVSLVILEVIHYRGHSVYSKSDTEGITRYMHEWIRHGGRVAIWTRDMTWAGSLETRNLLTEKAQRKELILCLPAANEIANELAAAGADVCAYGEQLLESPTSRFTIVDYGRDGARVAVGRADGDSHVIDEFKAGGHPAFHLALDLVTLARALKQKQNQ